MTALAVFVGVGVQAQAIGPKNPVRTGVGTAEMSQAIAQGPGARGAIAILPDTQFYSRYGVDGSDLYATQYPTIADPFETQTRWITTHAAKYHIAMTQHLGDVVDQVGHKDQWVVADRAMKVLEDAGQPYAVIPGNHDLPGENYNTYFGVERQARSSSFGGAAPSGQSNWHQFTVAGVPMISLNIGWAASDADFAWARTVLASHRQVPPVLTSHQIINIDAAGTAIDTEFGERVWNELVNPNNQVFLTYNGHHHGATNRVRTNASGQPVLQQLLDYQMAYQGGNGLMAMVEFDFTHNQLSQTSFSPWVLDKPRASLNEFDQALLTTPGDTYTIPLDFTARFKSFGAQITPSGSLGSASRALRDDITARFTPIPPRQLRPATNEQDYPQVAGTVAHWRAVQNNGVPSYGDISGNGNDMSLQVAGVAPNSVHLVQDHHRYSSATTAMDFDPASKKNFSYFSTDAAAPLNRERFTNGYTFETFIKIDPAYGPANYWMAYLARGGKRADLDGLADTDDLEEPPVAGAISSLTEVQWAFTSAGAQSHGYSNWSGEVDKDKWMHLAIVNDPARHSVVLYVDGNPMLRNSYDVAPGLNGVSERPWVLGGSMYDDLMDTGFFGQIGESRFVNHAIGQDQWLTARAPAIVPSPTAPSPTAPSASSISPSAPSPSATNSATSQPSQTGSASQPVTPVRDAAVPPSQRPHRLPATGDHA